MIGKWINAVARNFGVEVRRTSPAPLIPDIPERDLYRPTYSPWLGPGDFQRYYALARDRSLVTPDSCYVLYTLLEQALGVPGDIVECGVYKGGTAAMLAARIADKGLSRRLYLFDTFAGMPETDPHLDWHRKGDFGDTSLDVVKAHVGHDEICVFRKGLIPETFGGLEAMRIAFAHVDTDIYQSVLDCIRFVWPRLSVGGFVVFDDYGFATCYGARVAVDEFFANEPCKPLCLSTGQAIVFKGIAR